MSWPLILLVAFAVALGTWTLRRHPRFKVIVGGSAAVLIATWVAVAVLISADFRDADGFIDCWPNCTGFQELVRVVIWGAPVVLIALGLGAAAAGTMDRVRR